MNPSHLQRILPLLVLGLAGCGSDPDGASAAPSPGAVVLTWLSVTNWLLEAGETRVLLDGYVSRIDRTIVAADGTSSAPAPLDTAAVRRVRDAVLPDGDLDWILIGHGHWDHAFDAPAWAHLTSARLAGARTVCLQAQALGIQRDRCSAVEGGETIGLGPGITARVVRWHHSGDSATVDGRRLRAPLELRAIPPIDAASGGLRPGFLEDYPNGGGARAYLITAETPAGPVHLFWSNTGNPQAWDTPIPADSAFFREQGIDLSHAEWAASETPTRIHLQDGLAATGLDGVDLWIGFAGPEHVRQVAATLRPRAFVPHHWDDFRAPLEDGPGRAFDPAALRPLLDPAGIDLLPPAQFFDRILLTPAGASPDDGGPLRARLGIRTFDPRVR